MTGYLIYVLKFKVYFFLGQWFKTYSSPWNRNKLRFKLENFNQIFI